MARVLIVEDESDISDLIAFNLQREGLETLQAKDGLEGLEMAYQELPDLILLDLMLPGKDGYSFFKDVRRDTRTNNIPVVMLTARAQTEDRIQGLEAGADDYLTKPFSPKELVLRVKSLLRRTERAPDGTIVKIGPFWLDKNNIKFYVNKEHVDLTTTEFRLMVFLTERVGQDISRHDLLRTVWGYHEDVHSRTLDTHMKRLRQKLGQWSDCIKTIRNVGYRLEIGKT